jgi:hypothetical protein
MLLPSVSWLILISQLHCALSVPLERGEQGIQLVKRGNDDPPPAPAPPPQGHGSIQGAARRNSLEVQRNRAPPLPPPATGSIQGAARRDSFGVQRGTPPVTLPPPPRVDPTVGRPPTLPVPITMPGTGGQPRFSIGGGQIGSAPPLPTPRQPPPSTADGIVREDRFSMRSERLSQPPPPQPQGLDFGGQLGDRIGAEGSSRKVTVSGGKKPEEKKEG